MAPKQLIRTTALSIFIYATSLSGFAQTALVNEINGINTPAVALAPLRFLASDELMGRGTMRPEINIAARYISEQFRSLGIKEVSGATDYFQTFDIKMITPSNAGTLTINTNSYKLGTDLLQVEGADLSLSAPMIYAGFGTKADLDKIDVKGKIVVVNMGSNDSSSFMEGFELMSEKTKSAKERGAVALIQRFKQADVPWDGLKQYLMGEHPMDPAATDFPVFIINDEKISLPSLLKNKSENTIINITGTQTKTISAKNVMGWVEGTDAKLKDQFVVLSAHYDHLGVAKQPKMEEGKMDSIYNGARDNAIGTTAVIDAARYFVQHPPKRSVLFIAYTAEEIGEVGSKYFGAHPTIPLRQLIYNLNIDNASYNDTTIVTVIGLGRTSADDDIKKACTAFGLSAMPDPAPEQNLFDRSDNTNLAEKGIPSPTFSLGIKKFDDVIMKRYHQLSDEVGNFDLNYGMKYINSFILAGKLIADDATQPYWIKGDKYEPAWKELYGKK